VLNSVLSSLEGLISVPGEEPLVINTESIQARAPRSHTHTRAQPATHARLRPEWCACQSQGSPPSSAGERRCNHYVCRLRRLTHPPPLRRRRPRTDARTAPAVDRLCRPQLASLHGASHSGELSGRLRPAAFRPVRFHAGSVSARLCCSLHGARAPPLLSKHVSAHYVSAHSPCHAVPRLLSITASPFDCRHTPDWVLPWCPPPVCPAVSFPLCSLNSLRSSWLWASRNP
jgi:hypothetical protein